MADTFQGIYTKFGTQNFIYKFHIYKFWHTKFTYTHRCTLGPSVYAI